MRAWCCALRARSFCFFFNDTATPELYTLSLHDALPIFYRRGCDGAGLPRAGCHARPPRRAEAHQALGDGARSEEHTSELQSQFHLVCRLLLEKKKNTARRPAT